MLPMMAPGGHVCPEPSRTPVSFVQHNTMESLLERGEKIDDLVSKSEVLGIHSKTFYKTVCAGPAAPMARVLRMLWNVPECPALHC